MTSKALSACLRGVDADLVTIEVEVANGLPGTTIIGLPDAVVRESRDRVKAAIRNSGLPFPDRKILVNLAPAHARKEGPAFDLAMAVAVLAEQGAVPRDSIPGTLYLGELSLDGSLRPIRGLLAAAETGRAAGLARIVFPSACGGEGRWISGIEPVGLPDLRAIASFLWGQRGSDPLPDPTAAEEGEPEDWSEVEGQEAAKRAVSVAAAGGHHLLLHGPPGSGKTMLARTLNALLPPLDRAEAIEVLRIRTAAEPQAPLPRRRPFRAPHTTVSAAGFLGGGPAGRPGEISLAHRGVLFLDELPEFRRDLLESLRQPLERGSIDLGRARYSLRFPAEFQLVAAMNPCPCGFRGHPLRPCTCLPREAHAYQARISGPLLDRIDLYVEVPWEAPDAEPDRRQKETASEARSRVERALAMQARRSPGGERMPNARIPSSGLRALCLGSRETRAFLRRSLETLTLSRRGLDRALRVSRTIADLEGSVEVGRRHLAEALSYRWLDWAGSRRSET